MTTEEPEVRYFVRVKVDGEPKPLYFSMYANDVERVMHEFLTTDKVFLEDPDTDSGGLFNVREIKYMLIDEHDEQVP